MCIRDSYFLFSNILLELVFNKQFNDQFCHSLEQYLFRKMLKSGGPRGKIIISVSGAASIRINVLYLVRSIRKVPSLGQVNFGALKLKAK